MTKRAEIKRVTTYFVHMNLFLSLLLLLLYFVIRLLSLSVNMSIFEQTNKLIKQTTRNQFHPV